MIDVTNGGIRVKSGALDTVFISITPEDPGAAIEMSITIFCDELPWLINTLGDIHRELIANANRARDAAALAQWDADVLASMMTG